MGQVYDFIKTLSGQSNFEIEVNKEYEKIINEMANNAKKRFLKAEFANSDIANAVLKLLRKEGFLIYDMESYKDGKFSYKISW